MTKLCYLYLPRPHFIRLQARVFPTYFAAETALAVLIAVTYPPGSILGLLSNPVDLALLGVTVGMSALNLTVFGPRTLQAMRKRTDTGIASPSPEHCRKDLDSQTRTESRHDLRPGTSASMPKDKLPLDVYKQKRTFSVNHAMSIHLNAIAVVTSLLYGISLGSRLTG